jgi:uncharacterized protein YigE (DUF2233 family)
MGLPMRALFSPDGPKNGNFQLLPMGIFFVLIVSLGVGKRHTGEVSSKTARMGLLKARSKLLKMFS